MAEAGALGLVHRDVRVAQERRKGLSVVGVDGDADAGSDGERHAVVLDRSLHRQPHPERRLVHDLGRAVGQDDRELVAAEARHSVGLAQHLDETEGRLAQHGIARSVAERVVDLLEPVEVDQHHGRGRVLTLRLRQRLREAILEEASIRQPGEHVAERVCAYVLDVLAGVLRRTPRRTDEREDENRDEQLERDRDRDVGMCGCVRERRVVDHEDSRACGARAGEFDRHGVCDHLVRHAVDGQPRLANRDLR